MTLSENQKDLLRSATKHLHALNEHLDALRKAQIACNLKEDMHGNWRLDSSAIIRGSDYQ